MSDPVPEGTRQALEAVVRGRVQGVGFRWFVITRASELGVTGWVANWRDGTVHVVAEGESAGLEELLAALREGPLGAEVTAVDVTFRSPTSAFARFEVRSAYHPGD